MSETETKIRERKQKAQFIDTRVRVFLGLLAKAQVMTEAKISAMLTHSGEIALELHGLKE